jgi:hypothetical protein
MVPLVPAIAFDMQRKGQAIYRAGPNSRNIRWHRNSGESAPSPT